MRRWCCAELANRMHEAGCTVTDERARLACISREKDIFVPFNVLLITLYCHSYQ